MRMNIAELAGGEILAGSLNGRKALVELLSHTAEPAEPEACFLDFQDVTVATASFLRDSVLEFRRAVRGKRSTLYPVVANATDEILDDLALVLRFRNDAMLACDLTPSNKTSNVRVIGLLEAVQRETFNLVAKHGEVDARFLTHDRKSALVAPTAWSNRLAALVAKGLIIERSRGRSKSYKPVI
jgi:hypothetical protein